MDAKERIRKAMHQEPTDRPPCICPGGMMNMITTDLMDEANVSWPEAHLNARMMADLAEANYEKGCFENVGVPFCMTIEAEAMGAQVTDKDNFELIGGSSSSVYTYEADENQDSLILKNSDGQTVMKLQRKEN